jgi:uncharacterized phage-associated protein
MDRSQKILAFEYLVNKLIAWYQADVGQNIAIWSHFTRLTILKLLFLVSTVKDSANQNNDLLSIFNNFVAMQYGPVESDIYSAIVAKQTRIYQFDDKRLIRLNNNYSDVFDNVPEMVRKAIDTAIDLLMQQNRQLIKLPASQLVDITHKWQSWQNAMRIAILSHRRQEPMLSSSIRQDIPYYA